MTRRSVFQTLGVAAAFAVSAGVTAEDATVAGASGSVSGPGEHTIVTFDAPADTDKSYAVIGEVRTDDVAGSTDQPAMLETLNYFDGAPYFSRETTRSGQVRSLSGTADWRPFTLPFYPGESGAPDKVELRAILPGIGTVHVRSVRLVPNAAAARAMANNGAWWSNSAGGWIGGIAGSALGLMGGLVGFLAWRRADRRLVIGVLSAVVGVSALTLIAGIAAVLMGQPYAVYYPLLLLGFIGTFVPAMNWIGIRKRYEAAELQRLSAMDA